ncbi:MAG: hypothetical protein LAO56_06045 [Acidobacteriia bacterium]|nr:hypothetical protein [Terriglobia bacterium]
MKPWDFLRLLVLCPALAAWCAPALSATTRVPGDPLSGSGKVNRSVLTYSELFSDTAPSVPVDDSGGFALPANAAAPSQAFEGILTLSDPTTSRSAQILRDDFAYDSAKDSPWRHLASFSFQFVQNGSYLIPVQQGLVITGSTAWNYILGPGRVWQETSDNGYMRASFPFALVERNQNCVHNGAMTFLFNRTKKPNISNVRYQVTQETCLYFKLNMWGQLSATYTPGSVANNEVLENAEAAEVANRLPTKPFSALMMDYPNSGINLANFTQGFHSPADITTYGLLINGVHYVSNCQTRYGTYAFCNDMRLPSYSIAKSSFAGLAMMWLGQQYRSAVYGQLIRTYVPEYVDGGDWTNVTFNNAANMATGNYISASSDADEGSSQERAFLTAEPYSTKIADAFTPFPHKAAPGTTWVYQSHATFILTQAMNSYVQQHQGSGTDIFNTIRDAVFKPLNMSQGSLSTLRTDNGASGKSFGSHGLFFIQDDIAKLGHFLNNNGGVINHVQVLDPTRLQESLFRTADASTLGVPVPDRGTPVVPNTFRYHNLFWGKYMTTKEFPQYRCNFWVPFMSGYGGNTVLLLPNGAIYYIFSDGNEFIWYTAVNEINKIAPFCH